MDKKSLEQALADNLRWVQAWTDLDSQAKIAKVADVDQRTVGRWIGKTNLPTIGNLALLAKKLRIEAWQLLADGFGKGLYYIDEDRQIVPLRQPERTKRQQADAA